MGFFSDFGGDIIGGAFGLATGILAKEGAEERNKAQLASAREQMDFQREMSDTSHQREVTDLYAAGLNPILSARYGGASTPGGAQAQIQNEMEPAIASAQSARRLAAEIKNITEDTKVKKQEQMLQRRRMSKTVSEDLNIQEQSKFINSNTALNILQQKAAVLKLPGLKTESEIDKSKYGEIVRYIQRLNPLVGSASDLGLKRSTYKGK